MYLANLQILQVDFEDARSETMDALSQFLAEYKSITPNMPANLLLQVVCAFLHAIQSSRNIEDSGFDQGATPRMAKTRSIVLLLDLLLVLSNGVILLQVSSNIQLTICVFNLCFLDRIEQLTRTLLEV